MSQPQSQTLIDLSNQLAAAVERGAESILAVHARPQLASTGVHWQDGLVTETDPIAVSLVIPGHPGTEREPTTPGEYFLRPL